MKLRFRLTGSGIEIITCSEFRFCLLDVGIGVEFLDLHPEHVRDIEKEIALRASRAGKRLGNPRR